MRRRSFGEVTLLSSGRFRARYSGPDGERHSASATFDSKQDAQAWLVYQHHRISAGAWMPSTAAMALPRPVRRQVQRSGEGNDDTQGWPRLQHDASRTLPDTPQGFLDGVDVVAGFEGKVVHRAARDETGRVEEGGLRRSGHQHQGRGEVSRGREDTLSGKLVALLARKCGAFLEGTGFS